MTGYLAYSLAGHDKGDVFLIISEEQDYVYVADGRLRMVEKPKKKNKKHIQIIKYINPKTDIESVTNEEIKHLIKLYCKGIKEVK
jgi:ribosomal protein L14E/L6E/L27E